MPVDAVAAALACAALLPAAHGGVGAADCVTFESPKLAPADLFGASNFGQSIHIEGDIMVVSATGCTGVLAAYVFERDPVAFQWEQRAKIENPDKLDDLHPAEDREPDFFP